MPKPVVLIVLDGWGVSPSVQENVLKTTELPTISKINQYYPMTTLQASGISVGLPWGEVGNSEVGHITLGAGKIIYQNLPRITLAIQNRSFFENQALVDCFSSAKARGGAMHLIGLVGDGSTHSYRDHLYALLDMAAQQKMKQVYIHAFTDGRDSSSTSGAASLRQLQAKIGYYGLGKIATVCGRNWAMDRNSNWDRTEKAYLMLAQGKGAQITDPAKYLEEAYTQNISDEYVEPGVVVENGKPVGQIHSGDSVIFFNFREDRARQLTKVFALPGFNKFPLPDFPKVDFVTMTEYEKDMPVKVAFPREQVKTGLGGVLSENNLNQLRLAETEKYAHVTYFFNGGKEDPWRGEDRIVVPSPTVSRFDEAPEMSAPQITEKAVEAVKSGKYDFILINYANADMIGHTGDKEACIQAIQAIDKSLSFLVPAVLDAGGCVAITADHGNIEEIRNFHTGQKDTEHSSNPVPFWLICPNNHREKTVAQIARQENEIGGLLSDVAPTILDIMKLPKPDEMNGTSLLPTLQ